MDYFKIYFLGDLAVGKSSIINEIIGEKLSKIGDGFTPTTKTPICFGNNIEENFDDIEKINVDFINLLM